MIMMVVDDRWWLLVVVAVNDDICWWPPRHPRPGWVSCSSSWPCFGSLRLKHFLNHHHHKHHHQHHHHDHHHQAMQATPLPVTALLPVVLLPVLGIMSTDDVTSISVIVIKSWYDNSNLLIKFIDDLIHANTSSWHHVCRWCTIVIQ